MQRSLIPLLVLLTLACDGFVGEVKLVQRQPVENAPADAREVKAGTYVKTIESGTGGESIDTLPVFGYAETINPQSPGDTVTSLEEAHRGMLPAGLSPVFAGARIGETRRVWSCSGPGRSLCAVSQYTFYRQPK